MQLDSKCTRMLLRDGEPSVCSVRKLVLERAAYDAVVMPLRDFGELECLDIGALSAAAEGIGLSLALATT